MSLGLWLQGSVRQCCGEPTDDDLVGLVQVRYIDVFGWIKRARAQKEGQARSNLKAPVWAVFASSACRGLHGTCME